MFGINGGFGPIGDMMFIHNTKKAEVIEYAIDAIDLGYDLERCLDYGYETANVFPHNFTDDENDEIYNEVKERYDDIFSD